MGTPIQPLARGFSMSDNTGTPLTSPIATGITEVALVCPGTAGSGSTKFRLNVYAPSAAIKLLASTGSAIKCTIPQATWFSIPISPGDTIFLERPITTTVEFLFEDMA